MQRHLRRREKEKHRIEVTVLNPLRILWSTIMNRHRGSKEKAYKPTDLIELDIDSLTKEEKTEKKLNMKEVIQKIGKTFKKKKDGE